MKRLILIRHGETDYTLQGRYCGHENIALNNKGVKQANSISLKLKNAKIDRIYSSDLRRAFQTAKIIFKDKVIFKRKGLREIDFGPFSGLTFEEVSKLYPHIYNMWIENPLDAKILQVETLNNFAKRVIRCFKSISNRNVKKNVAIVSHGGPIRIILLNLSGLGLDRFWDIGQDTAALNIIKFKYGVPKILKINDAPF